MRVVALGDVGMAGRQAPEQFHDVRRDAFVADHRRQRQETRGRTDVDGLEQAGELALGLVEPVQLERRDPRIAMRVLAGRVEHQPAFCRQCRLPQLVMVEGHPRGLLGHLLILGALRRLAIGPGCLRQPACWQGGLCGCDRGLRGGPGGRSGGEDRCGRRAGCDKPQRGDREAASASAGNADRHGPVTIAEARRGLCCRVRSPRISRLSCPESGCP